MFRIISGVIFNDNTSGDQALSAGEQGFIKEEIGKTIFAAQSSTGVAYMIGRARCPQQAA